MSKEEMKCIYEQSNETEEDHCSGYTKLRHAMTAYHFEGELNSPEDPNKDFYCCDSHYERYVEYWTEMWNEYYSSQG